jgi:uncharacterized protein YgiM (DUF1202 family)
MMEINEIRAQLEKSSKRAGLMSMIGVALGVAALVFSFYFLNRQYEKLQTVNKEIAEKEARADELDKALEEKQQKLQITQQALVSVSDDFKAKDPKAATEALTKIVENNPQANQILLDATSKSTPGAVPPPRGARVAFCPTDDVRIRDNPDMNSNVIGKLKKGQTIYVMGFSDNVSEWRNQKGRWAHIQTETGQQGWVFELFVKENQPSKPPVEPPAQVTPTIPLVKRRS